MRATCWQAVTGDDVSRRGVPVRDAGAQLGVGGTQVWAQRITYVGELGYELYAEPAWGVQVWDRLAAAGARVRHPAGRLPRARLAAHGEGLPRLRQRPDGRRHAGRGRARVLRRARAARATSSGERPSRPSASAGSSGACARCWSATARRSSSTAARPCSRGRRRRPRAQRRLRLHRRADDRERVPAAHARSRHASSRSRRSAAWCRRRSPRTCSTTPRTPACAPERDEPEETA